MCDMCVKDDGNYDLSQPCCCARFVCSVPLVSLRRGWMERFKTRRSSQFYAQIEDAVKARWAEKNKNAATTKAGDGH